MENKMEILIMGVVAVVAWWLRQKDKEEDMEETAFLFNTVIEEAEQAELPNCEDGRNAGYYAARTVLKLADRMGIQGVRSSMVENDGEYAISKDMARKIAENLNTKKEEQDNG